MSENRENLQVVLPFHSCYSILLFVKISTIRR